MPPGVLHETLRDLFASRADHLAPLFEERLRLPSGSLVPFPSELTDPRMTQLLPDAVLACPSIAAPAVILIVEVHLQIKESKRRVWPQYVASAHGRHGCRAELVVVTPDAAVERWARQPIRIGHRSVVVPHVLGPSRIPLLGARRIARAPVLAMLSTLAHMNDSRCALQALRTLDVLGSWDGDADGRLADILLAALTDTVRERMEEMMRTGKYEYHSDIARKSFARGLEEGQDKGRAAGQARALLLVLRSRGLAIHDGAMRRIEAEQDQARLDAWTRRALTAATIDDVFADE